MNFSRHSAKNNVTEERGCAAVPDAKALAEFLSRFGITEFSVVEASGLTLLPGKVLHGEFAAALVFLMPYFAGEKSLEDESRISLYARSYDYHILFRRIKREAEEKFSAVGFCDSSPFAEVVCAASAGLGVIGRNGLLINGEFASLCFIGILLLPEFSGAAGRVSPPGRCEDCGLCLKACPTGCLVNRDAPCVSALTQKKGELSEEEIALIKSQNTIWGCDRCLLACPHNVRYIRSGKTGLPFFLDTYSAVPVLGDGFEDRAYSWRGRDTLVRNVGLFE
ncbi:MAG: hypothetical protein J5940_07530 [Clostridia bacterium]|nr:hypothetical protein [Clostridia bacterium]